MEPAERKTEDRVRRSFEAQGLMRHLGARMLGASGGRCVVEVDHAAGLTQQHGYFHGGVTAAVADAAAGHAALSLTTDAFTVLTVEFKINLMNPADGSLMRARAEVIKPGRTLMVVRSVVSVIKDDVESHCAEFLGTMFVLAAADRPPQAAVGA